MDILAILLTILYLIIFLLLLLQIIMILLSNDKILSKRTAIISILHTSCFLRSFLWLKLSITIAIPTYIMLILYFLPIWLNVFGISILTVFYYETIKPFSFIKPLHVCLCLNSIFFIMILIIISVTSQNSNHSIILTSIYEGYGSILDFILSSALLILGFKFYMNYGKKTTTILPKSLSTFYIINCFVTIIYFIRGILSFLIALKISLPFNVSIDFSENHNNTSLSVFLFFLILEWLPITSILFLLWRKVYFKSNYSNDNIEKLLTPISNSIDEESHIHINYNDINEVSDAEAFSLIYGNENSTYSSSYNLVNESDVENTYNSVFCENEETLIDEDSFETLQVKKSPQIYNNRIMHVGYTPPPQKITNNNKPGTIDFLMNPSLFVRTSPFAIISNSRESSPSLSLQQASPASNSHDYVLLSKYTPPKLGDTKKSNLHNGNPIISDRDITKVLSMYQESLISRDSISSESEKNN